LIFLLGIAYETEFIVKCFGWLDEGYREVADYSVDQLTVPELEYEVYYGLKGDPLEVLYFVENAFVSDFTSKPFHMRQGRFSSNYSINAIVTVKDVRDTKTKFYIPIKVRTSHTF
jgi:hypothetical protein